MKRYALRILSLLLVIATLSLMVSCDFSAILDEIAPDDLGNGVENGTTDDVKFTLEATDDAKETEEITETEETETTEEKETNKSPIENKPPINLGDLDFEGEEVAVLYRDHIQNSREWYKSHPEDELDEAIAMRNEDVQEALNIKIMFEPIPSNGNDYTEYTVRFQNMVMSDIDNGFHYYDISANHALSTTSLGIRDYTSNLLDEDIFPYFDFSLPCWNQSIINDTTINGRLHYVAGDINLSMFDAACVMWYNKTLYDRVKEPSDHDNIQDLALAGKWTYDELYRWATRLYEDSNSKAGKQTDDTYGFATQNANTNSQPVPKDAIAAAFDIDLLITNPDGTHSYNIEGNERAANARNMWINIFKATGTTDNGSAQNFAAGHYLFWASTMYTDKQDNMNIREMEDKYGLLPMPKYDLDQKQYYTTSQDYFSLMFVLDHSNSTIRTKGEAVSAFLQSMTEVSYSNVRGHYFNRTIKPKYFGTDDSESTITKSIALFDIIVANIRFDFWNVYSAQLNHLTWKWRTSLLEDYNSLEAAYLVERATFDKALLEVDAWFGLVSLDQ